LASITHALVRAVNQAGGIFSVTLVYDSITGVIATCLIVNSTGVARTITIGTFTGSIPDGTNRVFVIGAQVMKNLTDKVPSIDMRSA
jgi:hypothetical protein